MRVYENSLFKVVRLRLPVGIRYVVSRKLCVGAIEVFCEIEQAKSFADALEQTVKSEQ